MTGAPSRPARSPESVAVVGGGVTGLAAARHLAMASPGIDVVLLEGSDRLGGVIRTSPFAGLPAVDEGADSLLARVPEGVELCVDLGLADRLVSPATGEAWVWWEGHLHPFPTGLVLGVPARLGGVARSTLLSPGGKVRVALEPVVPRTDPSADDLGLLLRRRFGDEVVDRLVGPLVGGVNAGDPDGMSLAVVAPQVAQATRRHRSLLVGLRGAAGGRPPGDKVFVAPGSGMGALIERLADDVVERGVSVRLNATVEGVERAAHGRWRVDGHEVDAVLLAVPAARASGLVATVAPDVAADLAALRAVSVALVTLAFPDEAFARPLRGSGYLVPRGQQRTITACSFGSVKWPHWKLEGQTVLRVSVGREGAEQAVELDDDVLLSRIVDDLRRHVGLRGEPHEARVSRWPSSLPQYAPGHLQRLSALEARLAAVAPGLVLAGAAYRGLGVPSCIRDAGRAASAVAVTHA